MTEHWFWFGIAMMAVVWYSTITIYVAVRGSFDIRHMLEMLKHKHAENGGADQP